MYFGIDMATTATRAVRTAVANSIAVPRFVGRYLPFFPITPAERDDLLGMGCAILPIWNEDQYGRLVGGTRAEGAAAADRAIAAWSGLGAPANTCVYLDVEATFSLSGEYLTGWVQRHHDRGWLGGVYMNTPNGRNHDAAYLYMRGQIDQSKVASLIFASEPDLPALKGQVASSWVPNAPAGCAGQVGVWQYAIDVPVLDTGIDQDMASEVGWTHMWQPAPPYTAIAHAAVKREPNHTCAPAIGPDLGPYFVQAGQAVQPTGKTAQTDDAWEEVTIPGTAVHGWLTTTNIRTQP